MGAAFAGEDMGGLVGENLVARPAWVSSAATLHMVPEGRNTAASLPSSMAVRAQSSLTIGSSPSCSSPTSAQAMASRIAGDGLVWVSESRLMRTGGSAGSGEGGV